MAININTNFDLQAPISLDKRNSVKTINELTLFNDKNIENGHIVFCEEDSKYYVWKNSSFKDLSEFILGIINDTSTSLDKVFSSKKIMELLSDYSLVVHSHTKADITDLYTDIYNKKEIDEFFSNLNWREPVTSTELVNLIGKIGDAVVVDSKDIYISDGATWTNCTNKPLEEVENVKLTNPTSGDFLMLKIDDISGDRTWINEKINLTVFSDFNYSNPEQGQFLIYDVAKNAFVNSTNVQSVATVAELNSVVSPNDTKLVFVEEAKSFYKYLLGSNTWEALDLAPIVTGADIPTNPTNNQLWLNTTTKMLQYYDGDSASWLKINDISDSYKSTLQRILQQLTLYSLNMKNAKNEWYNISINNYGKLQVTSLDNSPNYPNLDDGNTITGGNPAEYYITSSDLISALANYKTDVENEAKYLQKHTVANGDSNIVCLSNENYTGGDITCKIVNGICYLNCKFTTKLASTSYIEMAVVQPTILSEFKTSISQDVELNGATDSSFLNVKIAADGKLLINGGETNKIYTGTIAYPI